MLNLNSLNAIADNEIRINNVVVGRLTDDDARKLLDIIHGMMGVANGNQVAKQTSTLIFEEDEKPAKKAREIMPAQDYEVVLEGKDNAVWYTATSQDVRQIVNAQLKGAGFTYDKDAQRPDTYKKPYTGRDGVRHEVGEHKKGAWVVMKGNKRDLATAKQWIGKTITVTAQEREDVRNKWAERKARREG